MPNPMGLGRLPGLLGQLFQAGTHLATLRALPAFGREGLKVPLRALGFRV